MGKTKTSSIFRLLGGGRVCVGFSAWSLPCPADTTVGLQAIDVVATAESETAIGEVDRDEHNGFASHIELNSDTLSGGATLSDLLDQEAGSQIREFGGFGSYSSISLRGASSDQVMIFLDGLLLNNGAEGGVDLSLIDPMLLASVDLYRGSTPTQLGKASFGGAVNLQTHRFREQPQFALNTTFGFFQTRKFSGHVASHHASLDGLIAISHVQSDNDFELLNDNGTQFNRDDDRTEKRHNAEVEQTSALIKTGWQASDRHRLDANLQLSDKRQSLPSWNNRPDTDASIEAESWSLRAKLSAEGRQSKPFNHALTLYLSQKEERYDDQNSSIGLGAQLEESDTDSYGGQYYGEWIRDDSTSSINIDYRRELYKREELLNEQPARKNHRDSVSVNLQHNHYFLADRLLLSPALRYQWTKNRFNENDTPSATRNTGDYLNPQLSARYELSDYLAVKTNYGRYVREPTFFELFGDRGLYLGNSELIAETGTNVDIGFDWKTYPNSDVIQSANLQLSLWYNRVEEMITRSFDARGVGKSQNISSANLRGLEMSTELHFHSGLQGFFNYTLQDPENRSSNRAFSGKTLPGRAEHSFFTALKLPLGRWSVRYEYEHASGLYYDTANLLKAKDKQQHNLRFSYRFSGVLSSAFEINNISDNNHQDFNGYPGPGRAFYLSIHYKHQ